MRELRKGHEVYGVSRTSKEADFQVDAANGPELERVIAKLRPHVVVNAIKPPLSTDQMEEERELAYDINARLPQNLAMWHRRYAYKLVQLSTDWVYEGREGVLYDENSPTYAANYYAETKLLAEQHVRTQCSNYLIMRTEGVFGIDEKGTNTFMRLMQCAKDGKPFHAASDQYSQPICGIELARLMRILIDKDARGIVNTVGHEYLSRYEFADLLCKTFGWTCKIAPYALKGRRLKVPAHLKVNISKLEGIVGRVAPLPEQLASLKKEMAVAKSA
jgi:dTDP-4-dehydrorhamnose reductase